MRCRCRSQSRGKNCHASYHKRTLGPVGKDPPPLITINSSPVERVQSFKLLGVLLTSSLSWSEHITAVCTKASKRLYFLKLLKRSGMTSDDLLYYYKTVIRPVTEYACAVWHSSITAEQRDQLEAIQRRAVRIIFGKELDFDILAIIHDIPLLADRRDRQPFYWLTYKLCKTESCNV